MSFWINTLDPAKGDSDVPVSSEINIQIESDNDLDIRSVEFYINDVRVQASSQYSLQTATTPNMKIVNISFFPRRRIKYGNEIYGAPDTRYGKLDILTSNFWYDSRYSCVIKISDVDGNVFEERFSFTTEEGVFFNNITDVDYYNATTQQLANYLPDWSKARYDKFSNFQQFLNPIAGVLERVDNKIVNDFLNTFPKTSNYNEMSLLHKVELSNGVDLNVVTTEDGSSLIVPPEIIATDGITKFYPKPEFNNDINSFYYNKLPDRLDGTKIKLSSNEIVSRRPIGNTKNIINVDMERHGSFCFRAINGTIFSRLNNTKTSIEFLTCRIKGLSVYGTRQEEEIIVVSNENYFSTKRWSKIESVEFLFIPESLGADFEITYLKEPETLVEDLFRYYDIEGNTFQSLWRLNNYSYGSTLSQLVPVYADGDDEISAPDQRNEIKEYELLDVDGQTHITAKDIATDPFSTLMYVANNEYLWVFDKREEYAKSVKKLPNQQGDVDFLIELSTDETGRANSEKEISFSGVQKVIGKTISRYRFKMRKPDGTLEYIKPDGQLTQDQEEATVILGTGATQLITEQITVLLTDPGEYIISLEAVYSGGGGSIDSAIVKINTKSALSKYKLERLTLGAEVTHLAYDHDGGLKVKTADNFLHTLIPVRDNVLIDYENLEFYFNRGYDEVEINA
jgi:hypothetical protein